MKIQARPFLVAFAAAGTIAAIAGFAPSIPFATLATTAVGSGVGTEAQSETLTLDSVHSSVVFRAFHMNTSYVYGSFQDVSGSMNWNDADPTKSALNITVKTTSVSTGQAKRDEHLRNADFFLASEFPEATFASKSFAKTGDKTWDVAGTLTVRGKSSDITVKLEKTGESSGPRGNKVGFHATFTMDRMAHDINYAPDGIGKNVEFMVGLQFNK